MDDRHQSADDPAGGGATGAPHIILLAEDDDAIRILIRRLLERAGYRALVARDGEEALALVERHEGELHLLLTDVVMPGLNGHELAERVVARHPEVPVVFMSGYDPEADAPSGAALARSGFLAKPFTPAQLLVTIRAALAAVE